MNEDKVNNNNKIDETKLMKKKKKNQYDNTRLFKPWVTIINIIVLSLFLMVVDLSTGTSDTPIIILGIQTPFDWALWPVFAFILLFLLNKLVVSKPELAWAVGPFFFLIIAAFLIILDKSYGPNDGWANLDWAQIPVATLLTFGTIIPVVTHLGRRKKTARERFEEFRRELEKENGKME